MAVVRYVKYLNTRSYLTIAVYEEETKSFMQPPSETLVAFDSFARAYNLTTANVSPYGDWLSLATTVGEANTLFGTRFETFTHPAMSQPLVRTLSVSLPSELAGHVDVVHPTTSFEDPDARLTPLAAGRVGGDKPRRDVPQSCSTTITPACLQALYGIPTTPATEPSNSLFVTAYDFQYAEFLDVSVSHLCWVFACLVCSHIIGSNFL